MNEPNESIVVDYLTQIVEDRGPTPGAYLGQELIQRFSSFDLRGRGYLSMTHFLDVRADRLTIVGRSASDVVWGLDELNSESAESDDMRALLTHRGGSSRVSWPNVSIDEISIERLKLLNYRSCADTTLELSTLTALVGANGSGKSTLLEVLFRACRAAEGKPRSVFSGRRDLRRVQTLGAEGPVVLDLSMSEGCSLRFKGTPTLDGGHFDVEVEVKGQRLSLEFPPTAGQRDLLGQTPPVAACKPVLLLKLQADLLAKPSPILDEIPHLRYDGRGLASVLAHLAATDPDRKERIVERVRDLVPQVEQVRMPRKVQSRKVTEVHWTEGRALERQVQREVVANELEVKLQGVGWIPADLLSEGTLFALGLHTVLEQERPPRLLLLDDVDRGLHPRAQRALVRQLVEIAASPRPKICFSTHSPYALDEVPVESVRIVSTDPEHGNTTCQRLSDRPEWQEWKESMTAGEFWQYVGEDWLETGSV